MVIQPVLTTAEQPEANLHLPDQCTQRNEDVLFNCKTKIGKVDALLPSIRSTEYRWGWSIYVFDEERNAEKNNIIIRASEGDRINGEPSITIKNNGGAVMIKPFGANDWKAFIAE